MSLWVAIKNFDIIRRELKMGSFIKHWETSLPAMIAGVMNLLPLLGVPVTPEIVDITNKFALSWIGFFAAVQYKTAPKVE